MEPKARAVLPRVQDADLRDKVVLVRVDHNVVKKGRIKDPYRIDVSIGTLFNIAARGGHLVLMTHVGRPRDKKTGRIEIDESSSVRPIASYLDRKLDTTFVVPEIPADPEKGIRGIDAGVRELVGSLKAGRIGGIYLPNTRWFEGEEDKGDKRERFARDLASLADVFVNDAFGSWQPHASTVSLTRHLPSFAGFLMQKEIERLESVLLPERPFVAVVAGAKYDTKIGPLNALYEKVDRLILGGVLYNTYLCAKYGIRVRGVEESDIALARDLVEKDRKGGKLVELPYVIEADSMTERATGSFRTVAVSDLSAGIEYGYFLDVAPQSFDADEVSRTLGFSKTIFLNAVMGFAPRFPEGSQRFFRAVVENHGARKLFAGGDTLQEFMSLCPGPYMDALDDPQYYFFTGGGTVLTAIEKGGPYELDMVKALVENGGKDPRT